MRMELSHYRRGNSPRDFSRRAFREIALVFSALLLLVGAAAAATDQISTANFVPTNDPLWVQQGSRVTLLSGQQVILGVGGVVSVSTTDWKMADAIARKEALTILKSFSGDVIAGIGMSTVSECLQRVKPKEGSISLWDRWRNDMRGISFTLVKIDLNRIQKNWAISCRLEATALQQLHTATDQTFAKYVRTEGRREVTIERPSGGNAEPNLK